MKKEYNNSNNTNPMNNKNPKAGYHFEDVPSGGDSELKKIFNNAKDFCLTSEEKTQGASDFSNFIKMQSASGAVRGGSGLMHAVGGADQAGLNKSPYFNQWENLKSSVLMISKGRFLTPVSMLALFVLLASTCYAATDALPGDVLYPVKIAVNEEVQEFIAVSATAKVLVNTEHAVNRLVEAEALDSRGKLDDKASEDLGVRFAQESENVQKQAEKFAISGDVKLANSITASFKNSIKKHDNILAKLSNKLNKEFDNHASLKVDTLIEDGQKKNDANDSNNGSQKKRESKNSNNSNVTNYVPPVIYNYVTNDDNKVFINSKDMGGTGDSDSSSGTRDNNEAHSSANTNANASVNINTSANSTNVTGTASGASSGSSASSASVGASVGSSGSASVSGSVSAPSSPISVPGI